MNSVALLVLSYNKVDYIDIFFDRADFSAFDEVLVIDDGSLDGSGSILREKCKKLGIRFFENSENMGLMHTYKKGLDMLSSEMYVALGLDDQILSRDFLNNVRPGYLNIFNFNSTDTHLNGIYLTDRLLIFKLYRFSRCICYFFFTTVQPFMQPVNWVIPRKTAIHVFSQLSSWREDYHILKFFIKLGKIEFVELDFVLYNNIGSSLSRDRKRNLFTWLLNRIIRKLVSWIFLNKIG